MSEPISNLNELLRHMTPELLPGAYVYVVWPRDVAQPDVPIAATIDEAEGLTLVVAEQHASGLDRPILFRAAWITLLVHSDLSACGLTAAVSKTLADEGIACNVIAGAFHDHLLVPVDTADRALAALKRLQETGASANTTEPCANCRAPMTGAHCVACGQARFVEADRRFSHLVRQFVDNMTSLDSRFWRSVLGLLFRPGVLTRDYLDGRRQYWMSPVALFLLANVLYFFSPSVTDFDLPFTDQVPGRLTAAVIEAKRPVPDAERTALLNNSGQFHSRWTAPWVETVVAERDAEVRARDPAARYTMADLATAYDARSHDISKLLIIGHVPMMALVLLVLLWSKRRYFAEHMIVSLHIFAFLLYLTVLLPPLIGGMVWLLGKLPFGKPLLDAYVVPTLLTMVILLPMVYGAWTVRRAFDLRWRHALPVSVILFFGMIAGNIVVYRFLQFVIVFSLI